MGNSKETYNNLLKLLVRMNMPVDGLASSGARASESYTDPAWLSLTNEQKFVD